VPSSSIGDAYTLKVSDQTDHDILVASQDRFERAPPTERLERRGCPC